MTVEEQEGCDNLNETEPKATEQQNEMRNPERNSNGSNHKNGDICWVSVLRDKVVLVEAGDGKVTTQPEEKGEGEGEQEENVLDVAIRELLEKPVNLGWQFYSPWQGEYKGIKFHVYDDFESKNSDENEDVVVWTFACIYYIGAEGGSGGSNNSKTSSTQHRPRMQAFLEKIMLLTEPIRQVDDMWRHGEYYACQEIYSDMLRQRMQEDQLEYQQQEQQAHVSSSNTATIDLDYSRGLTDVNREVVNRHNQKMARLNEAKKQKELELLKQMEELNQQMQSENKSKKWWSSSTPSTSSSSGVASQLFAAASRQIFSSSFSVSSVETCSSAASPSASVTTSSLDGGESIATIEESCTLDNPVRMTTITTTKETRCSTATPTTAQGIHDDVSDMIHDDDVQSVESINAMSDNNNTNPAADDYPRHDEMEDILLQLERSVTLGNTHSSGNNEPVEEKVEPQVNCRRSYAEEEKKEMEPTDDEDFHNSYHPKEQLLADNDKTEYNEAPKSPSSTMVDVVL